MTEPASPPNYKSTLNLPKTSFDMKANLTQREPKMVEQWAADNLYQKIRQRPGGHPKGKWVLHDGPPYANGDIHMGHLINKVLKDIVVKFRTMQGHDSPYVPGWDCHGLPIESAIQKEAGPKFRELSKDEVRKQCAAYAAKFVKQQSDSFQRLGIFGDFAHPYLTMDPKYEAGILEVLAELVSKDLVYRQKKPVHWCTFDRTALAEAELEYASKKDNSIYVNFELGPLESLKPQSRQAKRFIEELNYSGAPASLMIWTTTPWTLPANRAVAVHPDYLYFMAWYRTSNDPPKPDYSHCAILAMGDDGNSGPGAKILELAQERGQIVDCECHGPVSGRELVEMGMTYRHPLDPTRLQPVVLADYVTLEDGTGLVHTAPGHGKEDYVTGQKNHLETYCPVLADGRYDDTVPEFLKGKTIWDANQLVIDKLKETGALFHHQEFAHEYPHCWRCKKPVIFRATEQWFVKAGAPDGNPAVAPHGNAGFSPATAGGSPHAHEPPPPESKIKNQKSKIPSLWSTAKQFVDQTTWIPAWGKNRIDGMLDTRPDWCISRQRSWGVPIPAFYDEFGNITFFTKKIVDRVARYFRDHGADSWYTHSAAQILGIDPDNPMPGLNALELGLGTDVRTLQKGSDILDVWFESGASHHAVLEGTHPELGYPADMYLEGSDQHRGWFQSSLLEASGYKSVPPFKQVLTHGFVVDDQGKKYSKSSGNYVPVDKLLQQHGADVLRLWVSSVDYQNDIKFSAGNITSTSEAYRKIRNTMRYLLGNLYDFDPSNRVNPITPCSIDEWMVSKAESVFGGAHNAYDSYQFHTAFRLLYEFCNIDVSAIYAKAIKDRLYCELPNDRMRRSSQTVCYDILVQLVTYLAPILPFTAEEAWSAIRNLPGGNSLPVSVHLVELKRPVGGVGVAAWRETFMPLVEKGNKQLDDLKRSIGLGNPLDAEAVIILPKELDTRSQLMQSYGPEIEDALGVGFHRIEQGDGDWDIKIVDTREKYPSCARSWKRRPDVGTDKDFPDLSARDAAVVRALRAKG